MKHYTNVHPKLHNICSSHMIKMVKTKRELKSPAAAVRRRNSMTTKRPVLKNRSASSTTVSTTSSSSSNNPNTNGANIKVVVRVRPPNRKEETDNNRIVVSVVDEQMMIFDPKEQAETFFYHGVAQKGRDILRKANKELQFVFDRVFGFEIPNENIFQNTTQSLVNSLMDGFNCSVFAYGATGAGKTFTMIGNATSPGITFLTMSELFKRKDELSTERKFEIAITYLEVYNEVVLDLLNPGAPLNLREDAKYGVMVAGIKMHKICSPEELFMLLEEGNKNRTQHPTDANAESSRSHAVFQVYLHMTTKNTGEMRTAKLSMIDLAGSERGSATGCAGARFTEGANINKSLLALGNCINSLADGNRHVPYRDSKLTRLLKDSLGGNCQTVMIANISPSSLSYEDTYNTLKYANRAKKIKSNIKRNVMNVEMHVGQYVKIVEELKKENCLLKNQLREEKMKTSDVDAMEAEIKSLKRQLARKLVEDVKPDAKASGDSNNMTVQEIDDLQELFEEKRNLLERKFQMESNELGMHLKRQLIEDADKISVSPDGDTKNGATHARLGNAVARSMRKETAVKDELTILDEKIAALDEIIAGKTSTEELQSMVRSHNDKLEVFNSTHKLELELKRSAILKDEHLANSVILKKALAALRNIYLRLKGHGFVNEIVTKEYNEVVKEALGLKSIKWDSDVGDAKPSSTSHFEVENKVVSAVSLDSTFVKESPNRRKVKLRAENYMMKEPSKRPAFATAVGRTQSFRKPLNAIPGSGKSSFDNKGDKGPRPRFKY